MKTIQKIITKVDCKYGAPMGRSNVLPQEFTLVDIGAAHKSIVLPEGNSIRVFDSSVPLTQGYDKGGAYWGTPSNLRVRYTKDLSYIEFYRTH